MLVMLADKHIKNACSLCNHFDHTVRGDPEQDTIMRTALWSTMMKEFLRRNGLPNPKQADRNNSGRLALSPQVLICPLPLLGHHLMVTSLLDHSEVIIQPMQDGKGKRTFELGPIVTMSSHPWDSNAKVKQNPSNPPQQDTPIPRMPRKQTPQKLTPGPVAPNGQRTYPVNPPDTMRNLFQARVHPLNHIRTFQLYFSFFPVPNFPSPLLGPSPTYPTTPHLVIIIDDMPVGSPHPPPSSPIPNPAPPVPSSSTPTPVPSPENPLIAPKDPTASSFPR
ncbi:hypothetical protein O181_019904 [Austropuccinia psidii MF-1]|uniref:Uncharacterized protein n=1 Tax=Austropuccinia psidii MF-1 TaxID=1389203 RepID=A0A9Q3GV70_9BASI|nr:hypothetical protein [Austropuccinia psidii MF-1]